MSTTNSAVENISTDAAAERLTIAALAKFKLSDTPHNRKLALVAEYQEPRISLEDFNELTREQKTACMSHGTRMYTAMQAAGVDTKAIQARADLAALNAKNAAAKAETVTLKAKIAAIDAKLFAAKAELSALQPQQAKPAATQAKALPVKVAAALQRIEIREKQAADNVTAGKASAARVQAAARPEQLPTVGSSETRTGAAITPVAGSQLDTLCRALVNRHHRERAVASATTDSARITAAILAEHAEVKRYATLKLSGIDRATMHARRESIDSAAAQLGITLP
ncbi:MAG: hypothetical protein IPL39_15075 [Opitutaceae bacterium]|nr:hypothetical protein [Opitutaceae bacterium]